MKGNIGGFCQTVADSQQTVSDDVRFLALCATRYDTLG
jgi:hypothetical protein